MTDETKPAETPAPKAPEAAPVTSEAPKAPEATKEAPKAPEPAPAAPPAPVAPKAPEPDVVQTPPRGPRRMDPTPQVAAYAERETVDHKCVVYGKGGEIR